LWRRDPDEVARVWRVALGDEAWDAFAAATLLDAAGALDAAHIWALVSDEIVSAPWERLDRIWDLPGLSLLPGGRLSLPEGVGERMAAELRRRRPELARAAGSWLAARVQTTIEAAGAGSLAAQVGQVYLDRIARAAELGDPPGARVARLVSSGLGGLALSNASPADLAAWHLHPRRLGPPGKALPIAALTSVLAGATMAAALAGGWFSGPPPRAFGFETPPHPNYGPNDWTVRITPRPVSELPLHIRVLDPAGAPQAIMPRDRDDGLSVFDASILPPGTYTVGDLDRVGAGARDDRRGRAGEGDAGRRRARHHAGAGRSGRGGPSRSAVRRRPVRSARISGRHHRARTRPLSGPRHAPARPQR
jgi:hypothetical protein